VAAEALGTHIDSLAIDGRQQLAANGDALDGLIASSDRMVRDADALVVSLNDMTAPNSRMRELAASANSLRGFTREIERNPGNLLKRGKAP
jgi:paraquat-inducible protein B